MAEAARWLASARALLRADDGLVLAAPPCTARGFAGGAQWMLRAMHVVRGRRYADEVLAAPVSVDMIGLGLRKYALAGLPAASLLALAVCGPAWLGALAVVAFYVVEVRMVFAFPLALDGSRAPLRQSHALVAETMGAWRATRNVMRLAAEMLFGGFCGRGFVRSWCVGCLAVVLWYEEARRASRVAA